MNVTSAVSQFLLAEKGGEGGRREGALKVLCSSSVMLLLSSSARQTFTDLAPDSAVWYPGNHPLKISHRVTLLGIAKK